jgi:branched-chain amino acid transport system substrate-binding protein
VSTHGRPFRAWLLAIALGVSTVMAIGGGSASAAETSPIVVGGVWSQANFAGADVGAKAAFNAFNAAGGLRGRMINFVGMQEDNSNSTQDIAAAKTLVNDHVFAVVPVTTSAWVGGPILAKAGIPYFGWAITPTWWGSQNGFSFDAAVPPSPSTSPQWANQMVFLCKATPGGCRGKTVAIVTYNAASGIETMQADAAMWKQLGATVVDQNSSILAPPAVVSDFTPYVQQVLSSNHGKQPDIVEQLLTPQNDVGVISQFNHSGFTGSDFNYSLYDPRAVSVAKGSNTLIGYAPWEQTSAGVALMTKRVKATDPTAVLSQAVETGYWSAELFIAGLQKAGPSVTPQSLIKVLNSGFTYGVSGAVGVQTFPAAHTQGNNCGSVVASTGTKFKLVLPLTCVTRTKNPLYKG